MVGHRCHSKKSAKAFAHRMRNKGFKASISKGKGKSWRVSVNKK